MSGTFAGQKGAENSGQDDSCRFYLPLILPELSGIFNTVYRQAWLACRLEGERGQQASYRRAGSARRLEAGGVSMTATDGKGQRAS